MEHIPKHPNQTQMENTPALDKNSTPIITQQVTQLQIAQQQWRQIFDYNATQQDDQRGLFVMKQNLTNNYNWGNYINNKPLITIRIYTQNINGIKLTDINGNFTEILAHMHKIKADVICFQEHNLSKK